MSVTPGRSVRRPLFSADGRDSGDDIMSMDAQRADLLRRRLAVRESPPCAEAEFGRTLLGPHATSFAKALSRAAGVSDEPTHAATVRERVRGIIDQSSLLDEYTSAVTAFNMTGDVATSHAAGSIKLWMAAYRDWKQNATEGALDIRYEDVVDDIDAVFASTVAFLAKRLGIPEEASSTNLPSVKDLGQTEANAQLPSSSSTASAELKRQCRDAVQGAHDYLTGSDEDPARLGLEWGLGDDGGGRHEWHAQRDSHRL